MIAIIPTRPPVNLALLPSGKTCGDCQFFRKCQVVFDCDPNSTECDYIPHAFVPALRPRPAD